MSAQEGSNRRLLPCPFCGGRNLSCEDARDFIACFDCGTEGPITLGQGSEASIGAWNRRATPATEQAPQDCIDAERWRAFCSILPGLSITYRGEDYNDPASLNAAVDARGAT